jgi:hypothetical protein
VLHAVLPGLFALLQASTPNDRVSVRNLSFVPPAGWKALALGDNATVSSPDHALSVAVQRVDLTFEGMVKSGPLFPLHKLEKQDSRDAHGAGFKAMVMDVKATPMVGKKETSLVWVPVTAAAGNWYILGRGPWERHDDVKKAVEAVLKSVKVTEPAPPPPVAVAAPETHTPVAAAPAPAAQERTAALIQAVAGTYKKSVGAVDDQTNYTITLCASGRYFWDNSHSVVSPDYAADEPLGDGEGTWSLGAQGGQAHILFQPAWMNSNTNLFFAAEMQQTANGVVASSITLGNLHFTRSRYQQNCQGPRPRHGGWGNVGIHK